MTYPTTHIVAEWLHFLKKPTNTRMNFKVENALEALCLSGNAQVVLHTQTHVTPKKATK